MPMAVGLRSKGAPKAGKKTEEGAVVAGGRGTRENRGCDAAGVEGQWGPALRPLPLNEKQ